MPTLPFSRSLLLSLATCSAAGLCLLGAPAHAAPGSTSATSKARQQALLKVTALARASVSDAALAAAQPGTQVVTIAGDYLYHRDVRMRTYDLDTFLRARIPHIDALAAQGAQIMFWCKDGYAPTAKLSDILGQGGLIAVADADAPQGVRWSPAPYKASVLDETAIDRYVVWRQATFPAKPQPWGLDTIYILPAPAKS
ncbi:hypothetical protein [Deinococcus hohokamensis]|uniref:Rhodanese domain-containing protein n=1 Tax=Deinococcus hohokamensis TaxID=309883 RepID=A0ABV9I529_9DEIO